MLNSLVLVLGVPVCVSCCQGGRSATTGGTDRHPSNPAAEPTAAVSSAGHASAAPVCRIKSVDPGMMRVDLNRLVKTPREFVGMELVTEGRVADIYEVSALVDKETQGTVFTNWDSRLIAPCQAKKVLAQGHFRAGKPGSRHRYVLDVEAVVEVLP